MTNTFEADQQTAQRLAALSSGGRTVVVLEVEGLPEGFVLRKVIGSRAVFGVPGVQHQRLSNLAHSLSMQPEFEEAIGPLAAPKRLKQKVIPCPLGAPGDEVAVLEEFAVVLRGNERDGLTPVRIYRADGPATQIDGEAVDWFSAHMMIPEQSRTTVRVLSVECKEGGECPCPSHILHEGQGHCAACGDTGWLEYDDPLWIVGVEKL